MIRSPVPNLSSVEPGAAPPTAVSDGRPLGEPKPRPWLTLAVAATCVVIFANVGLQDGPPTWDLLSRWGAPPAQRIWSGAYWGLVSSALVHVAPWHLLFNLYWLWILGGTLERSIGPLRWALFFVGAAIVSSSAQLALSDSSGIGLSGVLYSFFGFMWVRRGAEPAFSKVVSSQTALLFVAWLVGCIVATALGLWKVGNAAHVGGLALGLTVGWAANEKSNWALPKFVVAALLFAAIGSVFWAPWSFRWLAAKGYEAHAKGNYRSAVDWYLRSRRFNRETIWVMQNLALAYNGLGDASAFAATMKELRQLSPSAADLVEQELAQTAPKAAERSAE